ncbi:MAG: hypothetical protein JWQ06_316 [Mucilaginibacter sp.]|nr:hypothetical protein [Mucilaginibacter sp.]
MRAMRLLRAQAAHHPLAMTARIIYAKFQPTSMSLRNKDSVRATAVEAISSLISNKAAIAGDGIALSSGSAPSARNDSVADK